MKDEIIRMAGKKEEKEKKVKKIEKKRMTQHLFH